MGGGAQREADVRPGDRQAGRRGDAPARFPGYTGADSLQEISWEEWFKKFDEEGLALLHQQKTSAGKASNFNKLIARKPAKRAGPRKR